MSRADVEFTAYLTRTARRYRTSKTLRVQLAQEASDIVPSRDRAQRSIETKTEALRQLMRKTKTGAI